MTGIEARLFALRDEGYRDFSAALIPTVDRARVIGVRTPALRALAKELAGTAEAEEFLRALPHFYLEENNLHGFLIERIRDYDACVAALDAFLPYVDNWATCDLISPACFRKNRARLIGDIRRWMTSGALYTARFGIGMLMAHFLDGDFRPAYLRWVAAIEPEEYDLRMRPAWCFARARAKQYEAALPFLTERRLDPWTHNRTIQKAVESNRIDPDRKTYLNTLRIEKGS